MQSINLRSALLRGLENAKKNGVLGRDSIIRKTMLDDCKGERLEEVLAYFSTVVVKKVVADDLDYNKEHPALAFSLAAENRGYDGNDGELISLNLAHKASLRRFLERKNEVKDMYRDFNEVLDVKERGVTRRQEAIRAKEADSSRDTLSNNVREEMRRLIRNNWSGNEHWMETLVQADLEGRGSGLLDMPFDRVWRRVQQGRLGELEEQSGGLLEQLDGRVRVQKERLARWDMFRKETFGPPTTAAVRASPSKQKPTVDKPKDRGINFQFSSHHNLQIDKMRNSANDTQMLARQPQLTPEYGSLVEGLKEELARQRTMDTSVFGFLREQSTRRRGRLADSLGQSTDGGEAFSEISELDEEPYEPPKSMPIRSNRARLETLKRHPVKPQMSHSEVFNQSTSTASSNSPPPEVISPLRRKAIQLPPVDDFDEIEPPPSPTQTVADQILESMDNSSPSPSKRTKPRPTLSLAQRTRLSMAGNHSPFLHDDEPELPLGPAETNDKKAPPPPSEIDSKSPDEGASDLVSRTRLSMVGFEKAQKKAQMERRRSLRRSKMPPRKEGSYFPKVEEVEEKDHSVLAEELMIEEDMEAVFKSRPKIKASPIPSPTREWDDEGY